MYVVSACLLGANCKYNGGNNDNEAVKDFCEGHKVLAVCPETEGGLKSPRPPAEQIRCPSDEGCGSNADSCVIRVVNKNGEDLTEYFRRGAEICLKKVLDSGEPPEVAILKANSPSCGCGKIYDGTFTGTLTDGDGIFAALLKEHGIKVITEIVVKK